MENLIIFTDKILTSDYVIIIYLAVYILLVLSVRMISGYWSIGFLTATVIPCLNITAYLTGWLTPEFKPFLPAWIIIILLLMPFIFIILKHTIPHRDNKPHTTNTEVK